MDSETVQSSINIPEEFKDEFKEFAKGIENGSKGAYSTHVKKAMEMYMRRKKDPSSHELPEDKLKGVLRRLDRIEEKLGVYEIEYDEEFLKDSLSRRFPGVDRTEVTDLVEQYTSRNVPPMEIVTAVTEKLRRGEQDGVSDVNSLRRGREGVTVECAVTAVFGASYESREGLVADRTGSIRFNLDYDDGLRKDKSYRLDNVDVVDRSEIKDDIDSNERTLNVQDADQVTELDRFVPRHGGGGGFRTEGLVVGFDETATTVDDSGDATVVAFLDTVTGLYRVRIDGGALRRFVLNGYTGEIDTDVLETAMDELRGEYYTVKGFDNTDSDEESDDRDTFSGVVAAEIRRGVELLWDSEVRQLPTLEYDRKSPGIRAFPSEIDRVDRTSEELPPEYADPNVEKTRYVKTPVGGHKAGRLLAAGVLTRVESNPGSTRGYLTDATGSRISFLVSERYASDVAERLREEIVPPAHTFVRGLPNEHDDEMVFNVRRLGEIDEYTYDVWVREAVRRTQARLRNPKEEKPYGTHSEEVWRSIRDGIRGHYGDDIL